MGRPKGANGLGGSIMPKTRDVLSHVAVSTAKGRRRCFRNPAHIIKAGDQVLTIKIGPDNSKHSYCSKCAQKILVTVTNRLHDITETLDQSFASLLSTGEMVSKDYEQRDVWTRGNL